MTNRIINTTKLVTEKSKEKIFFGEYSGFQRYDNPTYKIAVTLEEKMRNAFWNPNEISMVNDAQKFFTMPEHIQEIMIQIWLFQTLMDSGQNKGLEEVLSELASNPEFEALFKTWGYFELIHSLSYSHIIRSIFPDAKAIFDKIKDYPHIQKRIDKEIELYTRVKNINDIEDSTERKKLVLELLLNVYALEGVKFYVSFLITYAVNNSYMNSIQGATRIIKLINFDEDFHTGAAVALLKILKNEKREGFSELMKTQWYEDMVNKTFKDVYNDELQFAKDLLSVGHIPTLTLPVIDDFLKCYVDRRRQIIGHGKVFNQDETDIVKWFKTYKNLNLDNSALQESDAAVYSIGILKDDLPNGRLEIDFSRDIH